MPLLVTEITEFNQLFVETAIQSSNFQVMIFKNLEHTMVGLLLKVGRE